MQTRMSCELPPDCLSCSARQMLREDKRACVRIMQRNMPQSYSKQQGASHAALPGCVLTGDALRLHHPRPCQAQTAHPSLASLTNAGASPHRRLAAPPNENQQHMPTKLGTHLHLSQGNLSGPMRFVLKRVR